MQMEFVNFDSSVQVSNEKTIFGEIHFTGPQPWIPVEEQFNEFYLFSVTYGSQRLSCKVSLLHGGFQEWDFAEGNCGGLDGRTQLHRVQRGGA